MKKMLMASAAAFVLATIPLAAGAQQQMDPQAQQGAPGMLERSDDSVERQDQSAQPPTDMQRQDQAAQPRAGVPQDESPQQAGTPQDQAAEPQAGRQDEPPQQADMPQDPPPQQAGMEQQDQQIEQSRIQVQQSIQLLQDDPKQGAAQAEQALVEVEQNVQQLRQGPAGRQAEGELSQLQVQIEQARQQLQQDPQQAAQTLQQVEHSLLQISERIHATQTTPVTGAAPADAAPGAVVGKTAVSPDGSNLGKIDNVVAHADGQIEFAILAHGGVLGIGATRVAIPWDRVQLAEGRDEVIINMSEEQVSELPEYEERPAD